VFAGEVAGGRDNCPIGVVQAGVVIAVIGGRVHGACFANGVGIAG
jgi:hypothetical protein